MKLSLNHVAVSLYSKQNDHSDINLPL